MTQQLRTNKQNQSHPQTNPRKTCCRQQTLTPGKTVVRSEVGTRTHISLLPLQCSPHVSILPREVVGMLPCFEQQLLGSIPQIQWTLGS